VAEPAREQILAAIASTLGTMTGIRPWGGSYKNDPVIERRMKVLPQIVQFPHLCIVEGAGSTLTFQDTGGGTGRYLHEFRVSIYGYVKGDDVVPRSTWLQRLWDDVVRTLLAQARLGGVARDLRPVGELDTDEGQLETVGVFAQDFIVERDEDFTVD
jgi:hypothetical protein